MADAVSDILVILLHGVGSNGESLASLGKRLATALPSAFFAAPDGPEPSATGQGRQWFSVVGVTAENRPARIAAARPGFDATVSAIIEENGFVGRLDRVAFVGFSQGTIMSLDAIASGRWPVGAVVGFSGRLSAPEPHAPKGSTPLLLVHGTDDRVISAEETENAAGKLAALGLPVEMRIEPGLGHTISGSGAAYAGEFLAKVFGAVTTA
ncbi:dienelactone hydrolase family protein [Rhizobium sp. XQZ8]|uniref:alpha/beta hydrolase n=1 Tax=Rhizobium populisoli TaxID=2859785 RepID=UPI001CA4E424|nr:dienelactone hydrolase family protein [Rhizobium populisoli]MBW6421153.1 dienelactone hydrolase family protein [Rhizobium populisoli]